MLRDWPDLAALASWYARGGGTIRDGRELSMESASWEEMGDRLVKVGYATRGAAGLTPTFEGREFMMRVNELLRLVELERRGDGISAIARADVRGSAVDIGCGTGHSARRLALLGYDRVFAYDTSSIAMGIAREVTADVKDRVTLLQKDATDLEDVPDASVGLVHARIAFYYLAVEPTARSLGRVLMPGGKVVGEVKSPRHYGRILHDARKLQIKRAARSAFVLLRTALYEVARIQPKMGAVSHEIAWTRRTIRRFAREAGLEIGAIRYDPGLKGYSFVLNRPTSRPLRGSAGAPAR